MNKIETDSNKKKLLFKFETTKPSKTKMYQKSSSNYSNNKISNSKYDNFISTNNDYSDDNRYKLSGKFLILYILCLFFMLN